MPCRTPPPSLPVPPGRRAVAALLGTAAVLAACAQAAAPAAPSAPGLRVLLHTASDWPDATSAADRAAVLAGVPVAQASALGPRRYVLHLACADAAACERALARLRAEAGFAQSVEIDARDRLPARPAPSAAR